MPDDISLIERNTIQQLLAGGQGAQAEYFNEARDELKRLTRFRLDRRLARRLDESDILQEAYIEYCDRIERYLESPKIPPAVWLRRLVRQVISRQNRNHVGAQCRDLRREMHLYSSAAVNINQLSASLTSIGSRLNREELHTRLLEIVEAMSKTEREILVMVHFEEKTVREAALELGINVEAAKKRYRRALNRLRDVHASELVALRG